MSAPTEREVVLRERRAYVCGVQRMYICGAVPGNAETSLACDKCEAEAESRYPLPTVTRPRIVEDPHSGPNGFWRGDGEFGGGPVILFSKNRYVDKHAWAPSGWGPVVTVERCKLWADLLANPTETVPEDA